MNTKKWNEQNIKTEAKKYNSRTEFARQSSRAYVVARILGVLDEACEHMNTIKKQSRWLPETILAEAKKYKSRTEFSNGSAGAYQAARNLGILDEACEHMIRVKKQSKWLPETILIEAKKYNTRTKFRNGSTGAYEAAIRFGILDEVCEHMIRVKKQSKWLPETILIEAKKYNARTKFKDSSAGAYLAAKRLGILDEACEHMIRVKKQSKWLPETILIEAKKYSTRTKFRNGSVGAYEAARKLSILDKACEHMGGIKRHCKWLPETIVAEAQKYSTRTGFKKGSAGAYSAARKLGILGDAYSHIKEKLTAKEVSEVAQRYSSRKEFYTNEPKVRARAVKLKILGEVCSHMPKKTREGPSYEEVQMEAKKFSTRTEFMSKSIRLYNAARRYGWMNLVCEHMRNARTKPPLSIEDVYQKAKEYKTRTEFISGARAAYEAGKAFGILDKACAHMPSIEKWNKSTILTVAQKYTSRSEFYQCNQAAYQKARKLNILDEVCAHMKIKWTEDLVSKEAKKYKKRVEFSKQSSRAYEAARRLGILDEVCEHMSYIKRHCKWLPETILTEAQKYSTRIGFKKGSAGAYEAARKLGILDKVYNHME